MTKERADQNLGELLKIAEDRMYRNKLMERKSTRSAIIYSLQKTVQEKSLEMGEHAVRLKSMALDAGRAIGLPDDKLDELSLLAMLHDIASWQYRIRYWVNRVDYFLKNGKRCKVTSRSATGLWNQHRSWPVLERHCLLITNGGMGRATPKG